MGIKIKGLDKINRKLEKLENLTEDVDAVLSAGAINITQTAISLAPVDEGRLKNSINYNTSKFLHKEVTTNVFYAPYIEFGTGKRVEIPAGLADVAAQARGKSRGSFEDFVQSILRWGKKKGIIKGGKNELFQAKRLALAILKNGIKPHPFFFEAERREEPKIVMNIEKIIKAATK